ncbi:vWA domain-containing protein [Leptospira sp. GIMC2001]|uniref:vWA domain-containing protein n=1 Tax=Leptospira sp. GIMC2001 TaxID=1513297 RepID=UPI00234BC282|nr:VWA domain-containing protein [Leptospira sp. GIMC2001]WCL48225.1 VWA domain-containing protein [Leptospira sp. GIMC2001]
MGFESPWLIILLIGVKWFLPNDRNQNIIKYSPVGWLKNNSSGNISKNHSNNLKWKIVIWMPALIYSLLVIGLARGYYTSTRESVRLDGIDLVISLDLSASMQANDFTPNRLEAMKSMVGEYLSEGRGNRTAISVFSGKVFQHYPFSQNKYVLQRAIESIHFQTINHNTAGGTAIGDAILFSISMLDKVKLENRKQALVIITDGENTEGVDPILAAKSCLEKGIHLYIVGLAGLTPVPVFYRDAPFLGSDGQPLITSLQDESLEAIATSGGGQYYRATQGDSFRSILREINELEKHPLDVNDVYENHSISFWIGLAALLAFLIHLVGGGFWFRRPIL